MRFTNSHHVLSTSHKIMYVILRMDVCTCICSALVLLYRAGFVVSTSQLLSEFIQFTPLFTELRLQRRDLVIFTFQLFVHHRTSTRRLTHTVHAILADYTAARSVIGSWHDTLVCLSVCLSVLNCIRLSLTFLLSPAPSIRTLD